jgi:hypothetical protein
MVDRITLNAVRGDLRSTAVLTLNRWGGNNYSFTDGFISGKFHPSDVWGWLYHGDPLELDDIQILLEAIYTANKFDLSTLIYDQYLEIPKEVRRDVRTRDEKLIANEAFLNAYNKKAI